jgi:hypothetical protein
MQVATIGLDLAKHVLGPAQRTRGSVFQLHGVDARGRVVLRASGCRARACAKSSQLCHAAWSAWRPARGRITGCASWRRSATTCG